MNYYCRQLGIVAYEPALPLAYANADTLEIAVGPETTAADDEGEPAEGEAPPSPADPSEKKAAVLGFTPPREDGIPSGMRPRKAKSRKAMFRTFGGADGF